MAGPGAKQTETLKQLVPYPPLHYPQGEPTSLTDQLQGRPLRVTEE